MIAAVKKTEYGVNYQLSDCSIIIENGSSTHMGVLVYANEEKETYQTGDKICVHGGLRSFPETRNDGEFNQRLYYKSIGVQYRITAKQIELLEKNNGITHIINEIKLSLDEHLKAIADEKDYGMLSAILLGDKSNLDQDIYKLFQENGIAHLIAISGLHVSFLGLTLYKLLKKSGAGFFVSFTVSFFFLAAYAVLTGNGISARRAVIMCVIQMGAYVLGRSYDMLSALALSAMVFLTENPYVCFHSGFQMSFLAVLGICVLVPVLENIFQQKINAVIKSMLGSAGISLFMLPIIMYNYFEIPLYSILLNIIVIPLMSLVLFCGVAALAISYLYMPFAVFFMGTAHYILKLYIILCDFVSRLPFSTVETGRPQIWQIVLFYSLMFFMVLVTWLSQSKKVLKKYFFKYDKKKIRKFKNIICLASLSASVIILLYKPSVLFTVDMVDVGQGDCILIRNRQLNMLFDGGSSDINNVGEKRIYPLLKSYAVKQLDYVFVSHSDSDHVNGIMELMDKPVKIKNLVLPDIIHSAVKAPDESYIRLVQKADACKINIIYVSAGWGVKLSNEIDITCLHPTHGYLYESTNDYSAVYRVKWNDFSILMTGDVENKGEINMLEKVGLEKAIALKTAHHGSASSSSQAFLNEVQPKLALISCGIQNSYGHPSAQTMERLRACGTQVYVTAKTGQIKITVRQGVVKVQTHLSDARKFNFVQSK